MTVSYRLIRPEELDDSLITAWRSIQRGSATFKSPYFCPEFTQCVGRVRADARVVVIENDHRAVGFFPHQRGSLGMGNPIGGPFSDFHGVLAEAESRWDVDGLMRTASLSVWAFDHLVGNWTQFQPSIRSRATSPQIDLSEGFERYVQGRRAAGSDYIRKTEGLARKLSREVGEIEFTLNDSDPASSAQLLRWKSEQYLRAGTTDAFSVPWTGNLLREIVRTQGVEFAGLCSVLRVGGRIVAGHIGMRSTDTFHYWFPAYDAEFAKYSTGIVLLLRIAKEVSEHGIRTIDLGKGDSPYKLRLMTGAIEIDEGFLERQSMLRSLRELRRAAEARALEGGLGSPLRLPLRIVRRIERMNKFR